MLELLKLSLKNLSKASEERKWTRPKLMEESQKFVSRFFSDQKQVIQSTVQKEELGTLNPAIHRELRKYTHGYSKL